MTNIKIWIAPALAWLTLGGLAADAHAAVKPRLLVLTDIGGDPDDQQSMIRLLLYANEFDFEGLIATASGTPSMRGSPGGTNRRNGRVAMAAGAALIGTTPGDDDGPPLERSAKRTRNWYTRP